MIIAKHAAGKVLKNDNLDIASQAKLAKKADPATIDATTGMFYYEGNIFRGFKTVDKILKNMSDENFYAYSPSDGGALFQEAVLNWVFAEYRIEIEAKVHVRVLPTPGGTGAIYSAIFNGLDQGEKLLFPDLCWAPYYGISANHDLKTETFKLFAHDKFNFAGFKEAAEKIISEQGKLAFIINDPCNNPTGYSLTDDELRKIVDFISSLNSPCLFIYDIAYLDFASLDHLEPRRKFKILSEAGSNVLIALAFSASKTFSVYGQRLGAEIIMGKDEREVTEFFSASKFTARNTWSNANKGLINLMIALDKDSQLKQEFMNELRAVKEIIKTRAEMFLKEAASAGLATYPYRSGFFITIPVTDSMGALEALAKEEKIYLLPNANSVRLAFCSVSQTELSGLAERIKKVISRFN